MRSAVRAAVTAAALTAILAFPAMAGGWAVTTFDSLPPEFRARESYTLGYTIKQHGQTPVNVESMGYTTEVRITKLDSGKTLTFAGKPDGKAGHYIAVISFPAEGKWSWLVTQGPFEAQQLGTINVQPFAAAAPQAAQPAAQPAAVPSSAPATSAPNALLLTALILGTTGAALLFGSRVARVMARRPARA